MAIGTAPNSVLRSSLVPTINLFSDMIMMSVQPQQLQEGVKRMIVHCFVGRV